MTLTKVHKDPVALTMTFTAEFDHTLEAVWALWADPRKLERWWGPPTHPATVTVTDHDLTPGGRIAYFMTGPEGDEYPGWWIVREVQAPTLLVFEDGFADEDGEASAELPTTTTRVTLATRDGGGTRMDITSTFPSAEALAQLAEMGMQEGMTQAMGQMDAILAE
ncbi:MAG: SRPBCC domain-containing protein [Candidatus Nanopelagicales bacterium]